MRGTFRYRSNADMAVVFRKHAPGAAKIEDATPEQVAKIAEEFIVEKEMELQSLRDHPLQLDQGGAQIVSAPSGVDFDCSMFREARGYGDLPNDQQARYYKEVEEIARQLLGPEVVHLWCTNHILRTSRLDATAVGETAGPIKFVHNDFTEIYGDQLRHRYTDHPAKSAIKQRKVLKNLKGLSFTREEIEKYRIVVLNTWRPIHPFPLRREPLAVCDNRSIKKEDLIARVTAIGENTEDPLDDFALEIYTSRYNKQHKWHYVDAHTRDELLVFKTYDSDQVPFVPTMHSAFNLPNQEGEPERESLEARVVCLLERQRAERDKQAQPNARL